MGEPNQWPMKKLVVSLAAAGAAVIAVATAHAQPYPSKPIKFLVPFAAGGPADTMARLIAQTLQQGLNQTIVIDNRPGAGGIIGARAAAQEKPDGYTLMYGNTASLVVGPAVYANPGYDPVKAFAPIALVAVSFNVLAVNPKFPANSVQGADRLRQEESRQGQFRLARPRHAAAHGRRDVQAARRHRHRAHSLQGHGRRAHRHHGRAGRADVREPVGHHSAGAGRQAQGARRHRRDAQSDRSRTCRP